MSGYYPLLPKKEKKKYLFLDDIRLPEHTYKYISDKIYSVNDLWDIVKNYQEFKEYILSMYSKDKTLPEVISFDYDLDTENITSKNGIFIATEKNSSKTGLDCLLFLKGFCNEVNIKLPKIYLHSQNETGLQKLKSEVSRIS